MHRISLAPVLSATRSRDSCWITVRSPRCQLVLAPPAAGPSLAERCEWFLAGVSGGAARRRGVVLLRLLQDLHHAPALGRAQRAGLHDQDAVADAGGVGLVVRLDLAALAQDLAVERVLDAVLDDDDDG